MLKTILLIALFCPLTIQAKTHLSVVLLSATWCAPCKLLEANLKTNSITDHIVVSTENIPFEHVDVSDQKKWKRAERKYGKFVGVPAIILRSKGKTINALRLDQLGHDPKLEDIQKFVNNELSVRKG